jgi:hypothetical protein
MANITKELNEIKYGRYGVDIRFPIHDALKAIADETPAADPLGPWYIIDSEGEFIVTNQDEDYVIAAGYSYYYVTTYEGDFIVSNIENDYCQAKE